MSNFIWFSLKNEQQYIQEKRRMFTPHQSSSHPQSYCSPNTKFRRVQSSRIEEKIIAIEKVPKEGDLENFQQKMQLTDGRNSTLIEQKAASRSNTIENNKENSFSRTNTNIRNRRKKKNRKPEHKGRKNPSYIQDSAPCGLTLTEKQLYAHLNEFTLIPEQLFKNGFPDLNEENEVRVLKPCFWNPAQVYSDGNSRCPGANTGEFSDSIARNCVRCDTIFLTNDKEYLTKDICCFHWGKLLQYSYTCCQKSLGSSGCTSAKYHVWNGTVAGLNEHLEGFVKTKPSKYGKKEKVYALDCEMCYTVKGLEVCKVTILAYNGTVVYDHFVKPENEVVDYNTRFSGVTESDVETPTAKTFSEVQRDILKLVNKDTILIGHGLDNDLRVLKLLHYKVVDTALIFPHKRGWPFRYSLKQLVWINLHKQIQTSESGHSPYEDALSCLELILFKIFTRFEADYLGSIKDNT